MNKNISQLAQQIVAIWKQLGLNQRISIIMATVAVLGGLIAVMFWSGHPDYALLYGKLDEAEAAKVIAALEEAKVSYQARGEGTILVPADKVYQVRMQMAGKGIPRNNDGVGFEIFDRANFGISDFVQHANYTRAVQGELSRTVGQLEGVDSARVMIVMPENRLLIDNQRKPTASVFVRLKGNSQLGPSAVNSIKFLVANSVEGLQANNVSVVDNFGNVLSENEESDSLAGISNNQLTARRNFEQYLTKKAQGMLEQVLGSGQAVVRISAEMNWDTSTRTEEKYDPDGQVVRTSTINDETSDTTTASQQGGAPGPATNGPDTNSVAATPVNSSHTKKKLTTSNYELNRITSNTVQAAGNLKRLTAAVFIAERFEGEGDKRKAVPRTQDQLDKLHRIVESALGIADATDAERKDQVTLEELPFNDQPAAELTQQLDRQEKRQYWTETAQKAVYVGLAAVILFMFWRLWQGATKDEVPIGIPLTNGNGNGHHKSNGTTITVEALNQLIRENPANMTQAVRTWLSRGKPEGESHGS